LDFLTPFEVVPYTEKVSKSYARIRAGYEKKGEPAGPNDLLIAATVLVNNGRLVTRNIREFRRIPGLEVIEWQKSEGQVGEIDRVASKRGNLFEATPTNIQQL